MNGLPLMMACAALAAPLASAQSKAPTTQTTSDQVVPAGVGEEGPLRYDVEIPFPLETYQPATPEYRPVPESSATPRPISFDTVTGVETVGEVPSGPFLDSARISGTRYLDGVGELSRSLGSANPVTATSFPWIYHARMWFTNPVTGGNYVCSGTLIDPKTMITAGHCVHGGPGETWMTNVVISPAWDGDDDAYGMANGIYMSTWTSWTNSGLWSGDQGYVRLDRPVGFLTGWQGYGYNADNNWWLSSTFHDTGYPGGCFSGAPDQLYYAFGTFDDVDSSVARSYVSWPCWFGGMSGGGVYYINGSSRYTYGNNSHGWGKSSGVTTRIGVCRIEDFKFTYMRDTFIPGAYPATLDIVPLRVRSNSVVKAGETIGNMTYVNANASLYDPPFASYYTDVYLSTNDNISTFDTKLQSHNYGWDFPAKAAVTVTVGSPPLVPASTIPGSYWVGIITNNSDADPSNDDTDGWDAQPITVTPADKLVLDTYGFVSPGTTTSKVTSATPNAFVGVYYSVFGGGPFGTAFGTLYLTPPLQNAHVMQVDSNGTAYGYRSLPSGLAGTRVWLQAIDFTTFELSNGTFEIIQ